MQYDFVENIHLKSIIVRVYIFQRSVSPWDKHLQYVLSKQYNSVLNVMHRIKVNKSNRSIWRIQNDVFDPNEHIIEVKSNKL